MLTFACGSVYDMVELQFLEEAEQYPSRFNSLKSPNHHLEIGAVVARVGPAHLPYFVQSFVGMLHFGIITKEVLPPLDPKIHQRSKEISDLYFEDQRCLRNYYLKRQYFERFRIQHYVKKGGAQVKETSLGSFLFGEDHWARGTWYHARFPKSFKIMVPNQGVEQLQRKLKLLKATLGEQKYSLFGHNCETYCMEIAYDKNAPTSITSVQVFAFLALLGVLIVLSIVIIILVSLKKKKKQQQQQQQPSFYSPRMEYLSPGIVSV